jgi:hypothetical protein
VRYTNDGFSTYVFGECAGMEYVAQSFKIGHGRIFILREWRGHVGLDVG